MCNIYENIRELCNAKGIKPGKMCVDIGLSKSILTGLKNGSKKNIHTDTAQKIADYFGVSVDCILGTDAKKQPPRGELPDTKKDFLDFVDTLSEEQIKKIHQLALLALER